MRKVSWKTLRSGDLARQAGVARSLAHYHEEIGLLALVTRNERSCAQHNDTYLYSADPWPWNRPVEPQLPVEYYVVYDR